MKLFRGRLLVYVRVLQLADGGGLLVGRGLHVHGLVGSVDGIDMCTF